LQRTWNSPPGTRSACSTRPDAIRRLAAEQTLDLAGTRLFYYETHEDEFDADGRPSRIVQLPVGVEPPAHKALAGFDVACFSQAYQPECSPLSCNSLAKTLPVRHDQRLDAADGANTLQALADRRRAIRTG
jgi:hypothetical protein